MTSDLVYMLPSRCHFRSVPVTGQINLQPIRSPKLVLRTAVEYAKFTTHPTLEEAMALSERGLWTEAATAWHHLLDQPGAIPKRIRPHAHSALGEALVRLGDDIAAASEFERAVELLPSFSLAALWLGGVCRRLGRLAAAVVAYRKVLRRLDGRRVGSRQDVASAVKGSAIAEMRLGQPYRAKRLLEAWSSVCPGPSRDVTSLCILVATQVICQHLQAKHLMSDSGGVHYALLQEAVGSATPSLTPCILYLLRNFKAAGWDSRWSTLNFHDPVVLLGLAAANRWAPEAPQWQFLDDKVELHKLLSSSNVFSRSEFWPESFALPYEAQRALIYLSKHKHTSDCSNGDKRAGTHSASNKCGRWWFKDRHGHGGHRNRLLSTEEAIQELNYIKGAAELQDTLLMQQDVDNCARLYSGERFTLRLYLVIVHAQQTRVFLSREGLVYQAIGDAVATNASQAALVTKGAANAAGALEAPNLRWLQQYLDDREPGSYEELWSRIKNLARQLATGPINEALSKRIGQMSDTSALCSLGIPKILGIDVILAESDNQGDTRGLGLSPWLLEVNRFPALGLRSPSDAIVKFPVIREAWILAEALTRDHPCVPNLECLEEVT